MNTLKTLILAVLVAITTTPAFASDNHEGIGCKALADARFDELVGTLGFAQAFELATNLFDGCKAGKGKPPKQFLLIP